MATASVEPTVTPSRQRMLDDMGMRRIGARTQHDYVRHVCAFAAFLERSPDTATAEDVRRFQLHQREHGVSESVISATVSALRFLFGVTLERPDLSRKLVLAPRPRKLPDVLSVEEVGRLLEAAPGIKYRVALGSRTAPDCGCPRSRTSRPTTSTASACSSASRRAMALPVSHKGRGSKTGALRGRVEKG